VTEDLRRALERLSERGEPAGIEALVERIGADLSGRGGATAWPERIRARRARPPWLTAIAAALVLALVATGIVVVVTSGSGDSRRKVASGVLAPERLSVALRARPAPAGRKVTHLVTAGRSLWAATTAPGRGRSMLLQLDPASGAVRSRVALGGDAVNAAAGFGSLWVVTAGAGKPGELVRVDAGSGDVQATIGLATPAAVATGAGSVWVTDPSRGEVVRVDPATNTVAGVLAVPDANAVAVTGGVVYVAPTTASRIDLVDAASFTIVNSLTFNVADIADMGANRLVASGSRVWALSTASGAVLTLDPNSPTVVTGRAVLERTPAAAAAAPQGGLWVALAGPKPGLGLLRPGAARLVPARTTGLDVTALAETRSGLWTLDAKSSTLTLLEAR
jgi:hypothetical protein